MQIINLTIVVAKWQEAMLYYTSTVTSTHTPFKPWDGGGRQIRNKLYANIDLSSDNFHSQLKPKPSTTTTRLRIKLVWDMKTLHWDSWASVCNHNILQTNAVYFNKTIAKYV